MLVKKELAEIPLLTFPKTTEKERRDCRLAASAKIFDLKKSGTILTVDIFDVKNRTLQLRFFNDGVKYITCSDWFAEKEWAKRVPKNILDYGKIASTKKDDDLTGKFLKDGQCSWRQTYTLDGHINGFASNINTKKRQQAAERRYNLMLDHFDMFPDYPQDLTAYCEKYVFEHSYIFIDKTEKGYQNAICGHCRGKFKLKKIKQGNIGVCPKCGLQGKYRGSWVNSEIIDKAKICIADRINENLILRWVNVQRIFVNTEYYYKFDDYYRTLYIGESIYSYAYQHIMCYGWCWCRKRNGTVNLDRANIYPLNLNDIFGDKYYNVDLMSGLMNAGQISFVGLLDNLKNIPAAEYLFKSGLSALASNMTAKSLKAGSSFSQVLGISRQYISLYKKFNIDVHEHKVIQASQTWVSYENFEKFRMLKPEIADISDIIDLLEQMSFERFINYFTKQKSLLKRKLKFLLIQYKDYISMAQGLKVDLSRKSVRFPKNIKESHDLILVRFNEVKHKIEDNNFRHATEKLYAGMAEYTKDNFCIVFPQLRSDLIAEGQSLNHCVGAESYYKNHIAGTQMIFFIRQTAEPSKSFFTLEINMRELRIRQLYGFGGCSPSVGVKKFANEFLKGLKPISK